MFQNPSMKISHLNLKRNTTKRKLDFTLALISNHKKEIDSFVIQRIKLRTHKLPLTITKSSHNEVFMWSTYCCVVNSIEFEKIKLSVCCKIDAIKFIER